MKDKIIDEIQLDFSDVMLMPKESNLTSRKDVDVKRKYTFRWTDSVIYATGITQANMGTIGTFPVTRKMLDAGMTACLHKHHDIDKLVEFYRELDPDTEWNRCFLSIGINGNGLEKLEILKERVFGPDDDPSICIDVPNGYIGKVFELVREVRKKYPKSIIMAGNVVTSDVAGKLLLCGADIVKIGIGGGSQCMTRIQTGVGRPQLSTILDCAETVHRLGGLVCSDGGITCPGDIGKAFGAGADFVMIGGLYAGTDEADGEIIMKDGKKYKRFYGMSSALAQEKFGNGMPKYRTSEGRVTLVPYSGSVDDVNEELLGGLRSTMTYIGAEKLEKIPNRCTFYRVNNQYNRMYVENTVGK